MYNQCGLNLLLLVLLIILFYCIRLLIKKLIIIIIKTPTLIMKKYFLNKNVTPKEHDMKVIFFSKKKSKYKILKINK